MDWTASDIALVVSTTATAFTAIAAVAVPVWTRFRTDKSDQAKVFYNSLREEIINLTSIIDDADKFNLRLVKAYAFLNTEENPTRPNEKDLEAQRIFNKTVALIVLYAQEMDLNVTPFIFAVTKFETVDLEQQDGEREDVSPENFDRYKAFRSEAYLGLNRATRDLLKAARDHLRLTF